VESLFGATFDPFSDKMLIGGLLYGLSLKFDVSFFWWVVITLAFIEVGNVIIGAVSGALVSKLGTAEKAGASNIGRVKMGVECLVVFLGWALLPLGLADAVVCGFLVAFTIPLAVGSFVGYLNKATSSAAALAKQTAA
jgi:phosphatidylglycerophosphate synthase